MSDPFKPVDRDTPYLLPLIVAEHVSDHTNDKQELAPALRCLAGRVDAGVHGLEPEADARGRRLTEGFIGQAPCPRSLHCAHWWFGGESCSSTLKIYIVFVL